MVTTKASERFREVPRSQALESPQLTALLTFQGLPSPQVSMKQRSQPALLPSVQATNGETTSPVSTLK